MRRGLPVLLVVFGCTGDQPHVATTDQQVSSPPLDAFVLYADRSVRIGNHVEVDSGDIGVAITARDSFGPQVQIGDYVDSRQVDVVARSVKLGSHSSVHDVDADVLANDGSSVHSTAPYPFATTPRLPLAHRSAVGTESIVVPRSEQRELSPGTFGALEVDGEVRLAPGNYSFDAIALGACAHLFADGAVEIHVASTLRTADTTGSATTGAGCPTQIGPASPSGHSRLGPHAGSLVIDVSGDDPTGSSAVVLGAGTRLRALVAAPHATITFGEHSDATGAFAASDIVTGDHVVLALEDGFPPSIGNDHGTQQLSGYLGVQPNNSIAPLIGPVPSEAPVYLSIGLPVSDQIGLQNFIDDASRPGSPNYRRYLTRDQFNSTYGAAEADYNALKDWATAKGLSIKHTYDNRLLLSVSGTAAQIEEAFYVNLVYRQMSDGVHQFVAVDREPSVDVVPKILWVTGFTRYAVPQSKCAFFPSSGSTGQDGTYMPAELRTAYLGVGTACSPLTGRGQVIGVVAEGSFDPADIAGYIAGANNPVKYPTTPPISPGTVGGPNSSDQVTFSVHSEHDLLNPGQDPENTLDAEMAIAMAPEARVHIFEGELDLSFTSAGNVDDLFEAMANDPDLTTATNSWIVQYTDNLNQSVSEMAARGISFFTASGDRGNVGDPGDSTHATNQMIVGGTELQDSLGVTETTWNLQCPGDITGGGILNGNITDASDCGCWPQPHCCGDSVGRPGYQDMSLINPDINFADPASGGNGGSLKYRNYPDVSGVADNLAIYFQGAWQGRLGTSAAAPLWAGFAALTNQYAASNGLGPIGFANPALYAIGMSRGTANDVYASSFRDMNDGVFNALTPEKGYPAIAGYDLATGWGAPRCGLITQFGTFDPTAPQTYNTMLVHLATGHSAVSDNDSVYVRLYDFDQSRSSFLVNHEAKVAHQTGWGGIGNVQDIMVPLDSALSPLDVGGVDIHLEGHSTWDVTGVQVMLQSVTMNGTNPTFACIADMSGRNGCDVEQPGCDGSSGTLDDGHFGICELDNHHQDAYFDTPLFGDPFTRKFAGCEAWAGAVPVTATSTFDSLEFVIDTGDDDLDDDALLELDLYDSAGNHLAEPQAFVHRPSIAFDDQSQWDVRVGFVDGPIAYGDIGFFKLTVVAGSSSHFGEEWNLEGLHIYGIQDASPWQRTCLFSGNGDPEDHFDSEDSGQLSHTFPKLNPASCR